MEHVGYSSVETGSFDQGAVLAGEQRVPVTIICHISWRDICQNWKSRLIMSAPGPVLDLLSSDALVSDVGSGMETRLMEIGSCAVMGRDPDVLENIVCVQGKRDKVENQAEKSRMWLNKDKHQGCT